MVIETQHQPANSNNKHFLMVLRKWNAVWRGVVVYVLWCYLCLYLQPFDIYLRSVTI